MNRGSRNSFRTLFVLWLAIMFMYCSYPSKGHMTIAMALSRLDVLHALVSDKTFAIDKYHENTVDKTISGEHYFSDQRAGHGFAGVAGFFLSRPRLLSACNVPLDSEKGWFVSSWICTAASVGVITAAGLVCLFFVAARVHVVPMGVAVHFGGGLWLHDFPIFHDVAFARSRGGPYFHGALVVAAGP